ncbi:putative late blight resistance protein R1B-8 [Capsicum chacoense]
MQNLLIKVSALQAFLEETSPPKEANDMETLEVFEKKIRDVVYKVEDRVDLILRRIILADNGDNRERACKDFQEELQEVEKEVGYLRKEVMQIEFVKHGTRSAEATSPSLRRYAADQNGTVFGMVDDFNSIIDRLTAQIDELTVMSIVGMGGIDRMYNNQEMSNDQLMEIVYRGLKGRRFLIVTDDIWNDSWNLFSERLFREEFYPSHLEDVRKHIVQQCRGLPLSIIVIVGLLGTMEPTHDTWKKVEENLSFVVSIYEQCQTILSMSYNWLPQHLKACFLYIGGFPEDEEISVPKLIRLWIPEQFVKERKYKSMELVAEEYLEELIQRSLILVHKRRANGRIKTCKIHDLLRQLCIREAQIENVVLVVNDNVPTYLEGIDYQRRVMITLGKHIYLPRHESVTTSTARSLIFTSFCRKVSVQRPCSFVSHFKLLKVSDVLNTHHCFCNVIPGLVHLRYVAAKIDEAPSLAKLWNLRSIIFFRSQMTDLNLPLEIWTMSKIRHLDIGRHIHMPNPLEAESRGIGEQPLFLNNLQTIALPSSSFAAEILRRTPNLQKLKITSESTAHWSVIVDSLNSLKGLEALQISAATTCYPISLSSDIFLTNLKKLRLYFTFFPWENITVLANLPNLEVLKPHCGFMGTDWRLNQDDVFLRLKYLEIVFGYKLERFEATSDNFPMLEKLRLYGLHNLEKIPQSIGEITTLHLIQIENCSSAAVTSAKQIQEEQESWGNYELQFRIIHSEN